MIAEPDLPGGGRRLLELAADWWTIAYTVPVSRLRKVSDGADDDGNPLVRMLPVEETNTVLRGRRGHGQFMAVWSASGKAEVAYWWTRDHEGWADLPRQRIRWSTPHLAPVKVGFRQLSKLVKPPSR
jgi:hypothetical protein